MKGIIALLPEEIDAQVRAASTYLQAHYGLTTIPTVPHVSLHLAENYSDVTTVVTTMGAAAACMPPLKLRAAGLGIFKIPDSAEAVLYVTVVRSPAFETLRTTLYAELETVTETFHPLYRDEWIVPHITFGHVSAENLPSAIAWLHEQNWQCAFTSPALGFVTSSAETFTVNPILPFANDQS